MFSVCSHPGAGVPTLAKGLPTLVMGYLPWPGGTYLGQGGRGTYLGQGAPALTRGGGNYLGQGGYLPWPGGIYLCQGVPTFAGGTLR